MNIRAKYSLLTACLVGAVVAAAAAAIARAERRYLEVESRERVQTLIQGVHRIAVESLENQDQLMLVSYLMYLKKEHPELALAAVTRRGHTSSIGADAPGLEYWERAVSAKAPARFTVTAPDASAAALAVSTSGVSLLVPGGAAVRIEEGPRPETLSFRLGFERRLLDEAIARAMRRLVRQTAAIAGGFMALGGLAAFSLGTLLTKPLTALTAAVGAVGEGRLNVAVPEGDRRDEVGLLSRRFNEMTANLGELHRFREDLLHTLTHELNTPLSGLKGYLELWQDRKLPAEPAAREEAVGTMLAAVLRMEQSLGSALRLFKSGPAEAAGAKRPVWLDDVACEVATLFAPVARSKRIEVSLPPPEATECVYADEELVRQIVTNLISNALKYTPDGGRVAVSLRGGEREVALSVADTGYGIAPEDTALLFTKFYRAGDGPRAGRRIPGTGLGLSIAHAAALALGGRIDVESAPGRGSVFTVVLPKPLPERQPKENA